MKIPILLYHDIKPDNFDIAQVEAKKRPYVMRDSDFVAQVRWLYRNGYGTVGLDRGLWKERSVALVFDDGLKSHYQFVYPILKYYGFTATFFIVVSDVGKPGMMTWDEIREMADNGMAIGSHTLTHPFPSELSNDGLRFQLGESKKILEERLKRSIDYFSSPTGFYSKRAERIAKEVGYKAACFSRIGLSSQDDNPFSLGRIGIKRNCDMETFKAIVEGRRRALTPLRIKQVGRDVAKSLLGRRGYEVLKDAVLAGR
jgi:peptidoglycan/xylan/chitin deacetylase (PgdA/CDA1 family)